MPQIRSTGGSSLIESVEVDSVAIVKGSLGKVVGSVGKVKGSVGKIAGSIDFRAGLVGDIDLEDETTLETAENFYLN